MRRLLLHLTCWLSPFLLAAQDLPLSNWRQRSLLLTDTVQVLDSFSIVPQSVKVYISNGLVDNSRYRIRDNRIQWLRPLSADTARITYRVLPFFLGQGYQKRDSARIAPDDAGNYIGFDYRPYAQEQEIIRFKGLDYSGNFTRGLSFGNNQDLVLNSNFNLQMSGELGDEVELLAAISDNNIPLQPEGNTQQLQEFDKIFIQLKRRENSLLAGDYELGNPDSYFMNFFKKLQGATASNQSRLGDGKFLDTKASVAIARGKFARNVFDGQEGNQGPYRLSGADGEQFIIILAGTEKVFIDGQLLTRGIENDYVIDYNRGDITFTNKQLITKDKRIIVEFDYSDQQYLRSLLVLNSTYQDENWKLRFNFFTQQDGKNSGEARNFSQEERQALAAAGDVIDQILAPGQRPADGSADPVRYRQVANPSACPTAPDSIFVQTNATTGMLYVVRFTKVPPGQGTYIRRPSDAFGTVFEYAPPDEECRLTGEYIPFVQLVSPRQQQMLTLGADFTPDDRTTLSAELALSNQDLNRFSPLDDADNLGLAARASLGHSLLLGQKEEKWAVDLSARHEWLQRRFTILNPYRDPEFARDWNIQSTQRGNSGAEEHLGQAGFTLRKGDQLELGYDLGYFLRDTFFDGLRHKVRLKGRLAGFQLTAEENYVQTQTLPERTRFSRPRLRLSKKLEGLAGWEVGIYGEREKNSRRDALTDSLLFTSFYYDLAKVYLSSPEGSNLQLGGSAARRWDFAPAGDNFRQSSRADDFNINGRWKQGRRATLSWNLTYRSLTIQLEDKVPATPRETFLGRLDYVFAAWKGALQSTTSYEIGSGQERKVEFVYQQVDAGEGTHYWDDRNQDGIIQFEEVELPPFPDLANVVRITQLTDAFIRTDNIQFNQSIRLNPRMVWQNKEGIYKLLQKFSTQASLRILRKTNETGAVQVWNPFQLDLPDSSLVSLSSILRGDLFFNRLSSTYDLQAAVQDNRNRVVLTTGFESRRSTEYLLRGRWNFAAAFSAQLGLARGFRISDVETFEERDYHIDYFESAPQISWQPSTTFRLTGTFKYRESRNLPSRGGEKAIQNDLQLEVTYNASQGTSLRANLSLAEVAYQGAPNTPVSFAMLNGLQDGRNYLWSLNLDRRLPNNIQLSFGYDGRKTGDARVVHVGRAQVRAIF